jgi:26S proteasome regulatory subunit N2
MFRTPEQFPSVVNLLAESYNPHVRCGAAMALGLACAGTGNRVNMKLFFFLTDYKFLGSNCCTGTDVK